MFGLAVEPYDMLVVCAWVPYPIIFPLVVAVVAELTLMTAVYVVEGALDVAP
jgi:hypothetical protein